MKINTYQLNQHLKSQLLPFYWLAGDEPYLLEKSLNQLHNTAKQQGYSETIRLYVEGNQFDRDELLQHCNTLSLFADKQRIEIRINGAVPASLTETLTTLCQQPPEDTLIIVCSPRLTPAQQKAKWFSTLERHMGFIPIWPIDTPKLPQWLQQEATERGLRLAQDACFFLAECTEGNLLAAAQALDKLQYTTTDQKTIDLPTLQQYVEDQARFDVYALVSCLLQNKRAKAVKILQHLKAENTEPTLVLWALTKEFRLLAQLHQALQTTALPQVFKQFHIWPKRQPEIQNALRHFDYQTCLTMLQQLAQLDKIVKGVAQGEPWFALQRLLTQEALHAI